MKFEFVYFEFLLDLKMESESLEEFEKIEQEMKDIDFILTGEISRKSGTSGTVDSSTLLYSDNGSQNISNQQMLFSEDPDVLKEFEELEEAFEEIAKIKMKATEQEYILRQENQHNNNISEKSIKKLNEELKDVKTTSKNS